MRKRTLLEKSLAALVGAIIGGVFVLVFGQLWPLLGLPAWPWAIAIPPAIGAVVGYLRGDKGIKALLMPFPGRRRMR